MKKPAPKAERRSDALTKERVVEAAIAILDAQGEAALTFRALAASLTTGAGAIFWHVADKEALLAAAAETILEKVIAGARASRSPRESLRLVALALFDAIDAHPWVGTQLSRQPWQPAMLEIYEGVGQSLIKLDVPERKRFEAWSALVNYILGVAGQNASHARQRPPDADRVAFLTDFATQWVKLEGDKSIFGRQIAAQLRDHDDRAQFLAGIDIILAGIKTLK